MVVDLLVDEPAQILKANIWQEIFESTGLSITAA
jgi:hypothetical protein